MDIDPQKVKIIAKEIEMLDTLRRTRAN